MAADAGRMGQLLWTRCWARRSPWPIPSSTSPTLLPASAASAPAETNLGDFVADGIYTYFNEVEQLHCDIAIMNGGGIRADEDAGYWTFKTCKQVSPFGNVACLMSVTGKQIQDALEFAARFAGADGQGERRLPAGGRRDL